MRERRAVSRSRACRVGASAALLATAVAMSDTPVAATPVGPEAVARLSCQASVPPTLRSAQPAVLTLVLHNEGRRPLYVLRRNTPFEGWLADSLTVTHDGAPVAYSGAMAKRTPPHASEYLLLKPGQRYRYRARLAPAYDVSAGGRYRLQWRGELMDVRIGERPQPDRPLRAMNVVCPAVEFVRSR